MTQELILTKENVGFYLFLRGFLDIHEFSKEFYTVKVLLARNLSFQLTHKNGKKFFIKQLCHGGEYDKAAFSFEMAFYEASVSHPGFTPVTPLLPRLYHYDPVYSIAVSELLQGYRPVDLVAGHRPETAAALARIGRIPVHAATNDQRPPLMHRSEWKNNGKITQYILRNSRLQEAILGLNDVWDPLNILHNDLKPGNILVNKRGEIKIIDWEKMSTGDALWDLAALICYALPSGSSAYPVPVALRSYIADQSGPLQLLTAAYREEWKEQDARRLVQYTGLKMLTILAENGRTPGEGELRLATDLLLAPDGYLNFLFKNYA